MMISRVFLMNILNDDAAEYCDVLLCLYCGYHRVLLLRCLFTVFSLNIKLRVSLTHVPVGFGVLAGIAAF